MKYGDATTARDNHVGEVMSAALVAFATTGDPNGGRLPAWPRYDAAKDVFMDVGKDGDPHVGKNPIAAK